jgi:hypothetical protein
VCKPTRQAATYVAAAGGSVLAAFSSALREHTEVKQRTSIAVAERKV